MHIFVCLFLTFQNIFCSVGLILSWLVYTSGFLAWNWSFTSSHNPHFELKLSHFSWLKHSHLSYSDQMCYTCIRGLSTNRGLNDSGYF